MNQEHQGAQMRFQGIDPTETGFRVRSQCGDDIGDPDASGVDDTGLLDDLADDAAMDSGDPNASGVDDTGLQDDRTDDATMDSGEPGASGVDHIGLLADLADDAAMDSGVPSASGVDGTGLQDDRGDDTADSNEKTALSTDDISLQDDHGDEAAKAPSAQDDADDTTPVGSVQESLDVGSNLVDRENELPHWPNDRRRIAMATPGWPYQINYLAFKVRPMTGDEFSALVEDTKEHGQRLPIIRWRGEIIDGVHRLLADLEAGVEPTFEDLSDDADPEAYVKSLNVFRRHLNEGEVIETAVRMSDGSRRGRRWPSDGTGDNSANLQNKEDVPLTQKEAAAQFDISQRTLAHGAKVFSQDSTASLELQQAVREDKIAVSDASKVVSEPPEIQQKAVDLVASGESRTAVEGVRQVRRESAVRRLEDTNAESLVYNKDGIGIHKFGVADLTNFLPQNSVDVVICAPAQRDDSADRTLTHAAILASHALTTEGLLVLAADSGRLPQQIGRATQRRLEWICQIPLVFESPISNTGEPHYIERKAVPLLLFGKLGTRLDGGDDVMFVPPQPEGSKNERQSMRHAADLVIGRFVKSGQVVCVPELSGGSYSLLMAAASAGCKIIAADDKPSRIKKAVKELLKLKVRPFPDGQDGA